MIHYLLLFALTTTPTLAHEGHDHDAPALVQAPKGGQIKSLEKSHVEVINKGKELSIYIYDRNLKPRDATALGIKATAELPRSKKREALALQTKDNFLTGSYDAKGSHRYTLHLSINDPETGHSDSLSFTIEPRK